MHVSQPTSPNSISALSINQNPSSINWDWLAISASTLCSIQCILGAIAIIGISWLDNLLSSLIIEWILIGIVIILASIAMPYGIKKHKKSWILFPLIFGILILILSHIFAGLHLIEHEIEVLLSICGSSLLIFAHWKNHRFLKHNKELIDG